MGSFEFAMGFGMLIEVLRNGIGLRLDECVGVCGHGGIVDF